MSANAITLNTAILKIAAELGELQGFRITGVPSSLSFSIALPTSTNDNDYQYARANVFLRGVARVTSHNSLGRFTFDAAFSTPDVGETLGLTLWNSDKEHAIKDMAWRMMYLSYPWWYREVRIDLNNLTLTDGSTYTQQTFDADTDEYTLPSDLVDLSRVVIHTDAAKPWDMPPYPPLDLWKVVGQEGAKKIKFFNNGRVFLPSRHAGANIGLWYMAREPLPSSYTSATIQLPEDFFSLAAAGIARRGLWNQARTDLGTSNVALPQLQIEVQAALQRLRLVKDPLPMGPETGWNV